MDNWVRFPAWAVVGLLPATASRLALGPIQWLQGFFPLGVKRPGREADHSPPSVAEIKNAWSYIFILPVSFHGVVLT